MTKKGEEEVIEKVMYGYSVETSQLEEENKILKQTLEHMKGEIKKFQTPPLMVAEIKEKVSSELQKQGPPRPGLVPKSGDWQHPDHWILPKDNTESQQDHDLEYTDFVVWNPRAMTILNQPSLVKFRGL